MDGSTRVHFGAVHLQRVEISNFRAYESATMTLANTGMFVVVGPNNSGKTSLLSAVDMIGGRNVEGPLSHRPPPTLKAIVEGHFTFNDDERPLFEMSVSSEHRSEVAGQFTGAVFTLTEVNDDEPRLAVTGIEVVGRDGHRWPVAELVSQGGASASINQVPWGEWLGAWPEKPQLSQGMSGSPLTRHLEQAHGPTVLPEWLVHWRSGHYHFRSLRTGASARVGTTHADDHLEPTGANLVNFLLWLRGHREADWDSIRAIMSDLVPGVGRLQTRAAGQTAQVGFETRGGFLNIKDAGTGVEQLLLTIVAGRTSAHSMLVIEEPETNLHPAAQRQVVEHLREWSHGRPIVIATHSPVFMDAASDAWIYEVHRARGRSLVRTIAGRDDELALLLSRLGVRHSDLLGSDRVLLVEGVTDGPIFTAWFPQLAKRSAVAVVAGGGGAGVWQLILMKTVAEIADRIARPLLYIRDRDELSDRDMKRLADRPSVVVLSRRELENYLLDENAIVSVLNARSGTQARLDATEVAVAMRTAADRLKVRVIRSRALQAAECLQRMIPVTTAERARLLACQLDEDEFLAALVTGVRGKLNDRLETLESCVKDALAQERTAVDGMWNEHWRDLVPGADVLASVFIPHGGYSKRIDGPAIAAAMEEPPAELRTIVDAFLVSRPRRIAVTEHRGEVDPDDSV